MSFMIRGTEEYSNLVEMVENEFVENQPEVENVDKDLIYP